MTLPIELENYISDKLASQSVPETKIAAKAMLRSKFSNILTRYPEDNRRSAAQAAEMIKSVTNGEVWFEADYSLLDEERGLTEE